MKEAQKEYSIRPVCKYDKNLIYHMRNMEHVRKNMHSSDIISENDHHKWFSDTLNSNDREFFIFLLDNQPVGVIGYYDIGDNFANWSFYLGNEELPKGTGSIMCELGLTEFFKKHDKSIKTIILKENKPSIKIHKNLGFMEIKSPQDGQYICYQLAKNDWVKMQPCNK